MTLDPEIGNRIRTDFYLVVNGVCERQCLEVHNWRTDSGQRPSDEWDFRNKVIMNICM